MCGVAGIFAYRDMGAQAIDVELRKIRDYMASRGPDGAGIWQSQDGCVVLGHRRLAIIDLSERGAQPMASPDGSRVVTFNGEIYNYRELRAALETRGYAFTSQCDTEVLLHMYAEYGSDFVRHLRGMFALALWDANRGGLLLARDTFGIKPLYYADNGGTFRFASQVKALLAGGRVSRTKSAAGQVGFLLWGYVPEPFTIYESIKALPAGCTQWIDRNGVSSIKEYNSIATIWSTATQVAEHKDGQELAIRLKDALRESVRHHLVSDVPVGAFLSAGVDSGALVALMKEHCAEIQSVTVGFEEFRGSSEDEVPLAAMLADRLGVRHHARMVKQEEFVGDVEAILHAMDQPTIDGVNTWFASKAAKEFGLKVAISGLGGDELLGGYPSFRAVPYLVRAVGLSACFPGVGRILRALSAPILSRLSSVHPKAAGLFEYGPTYPGAYFLKRGLFMPWELNGVLTQEVVREGLEKLDLREYLHQTLNPKPRDAYARVATLESTQYMRNQLLRDTDWASMAHSLEVRVPLVDTELLASVAPLLCGGLKGQGKALLADAPESPLPHSIVHRVKTGFSTPIAAWMASSRTLDCWKRVPFLMRNGTPWARRFAYSVLAA